MKLTILGINNKPAIFLLVLAIVLLSFIQVVNARYLEDIRMISVSLIKQEPDPVEPGKEVELSFKIDNTGKSTTALIFELLPEYPFTSLPEQKATTFIGVVGASQNDKQSIIVKYKLRVDIGATDISYKIKIRYKESDADSWAVSDDFKVNVRSHEAILAIEKFSVYPNTIAPGERAKLSIELKNYATSPLKDVRLSLSLDATGDSAIPFAPIGNSNEMVVPFIEPQKNIPLEFELITDADAKGKIYKIPVTMKYSDSFNKNYSKSSIVSIIVNDKPDIGISIERTDVYTADNPGLLVLRLVNKGTTNIKFLNIKMLTNDNLRVIGTDEEYIGDLESGDFSTADFRVIAKGNDKIKIPVIVTFRDSGNMVFTDNREVELELYNNKEARALGILKSNNLGWIIMIVVFVIVGYFIIRRRKKKRVSS